MVEQILAFGYAGVSAKAGGTIPIEHRMESAAYRFHVRTMIPLGDDRRNHTCKARWKLCGLANSVWLERHKPCMAPARRMTGSGDDQPVSKPLRNGSFGR